MAIVILMQAGLKCAVKFKRAFEHIKLLSVLVRRWGRRVVWAVWRARQLPKVRPLQLLLLSRVFLRSDGWPCAQDGAKDTHDLVKWPPNLRYSNSSQQDAATS